jgi:hypothetical protein
MEEPPRRAERCCNPPGEIAPSTRNRSRHAQLRMPVPAVLAQTSRKRLQRYQIIASRRVTENLQALTEPCLRAECCCLQVTGMPDRNILLHRFPGRPRLLLGW